MEVCKTELEPIHDFDVTFAAMKLNLVAKQGFIPTLSSHRTDLWRQRSIPFVQIDQRQHGEGPVGILGQAAIAHLGEAPDALEHQKRMLDFGTHRRFAGIGLFVGFGERAISVRRVC